jgi:hypothetical protein
MKSACYDAPMAAIMLYHVEIIENGKVIYSEVETSMPKAEDTRRRLMDSAQIEGHPSAIVNIRPEFTDPNAKA